MRAKDFLFLAIFTALGWCSLVSTAHAEPSDSEICAENTQEEFYWDVGTTEGAKKDVMNQIIRDIDDYAAQCNDFCVQRKCPFYNSHHHHIDGDRKVNSGSVDELAQAAQEAGNMVPDISVPFVQAAWEDIQWHCICLNEGPIESPVASGALGSEQVRS